MLGQSETPSRFTVFLFGHDDNLSALTVLWRMKFSLHVVSWQRESPSSLLSAMCNWTFIVRWCVCLYCSCMTSDCMSEQNIRQVSFFWVHHRTMDDGVERRQYLCVWLPSDARCQLLHKSCHTLLLRKNASHSNVKSAVPFVNVTLSAEFNCVSARISWQTDRGTEL